MKEEPKEETSSAKDKLAELTKEELVEKCVSSLFESELFAIGSHVGVW